MLCRPWNQSSQYGSPQSDRESSPEVVLVPSELSQPMTLKGKALLSIELEVTNRTALSNTSLPVTAQIL
jgi:hypothetical protein